MFRITVKSNPTATALLAHHKISFIKMFRSFSGTGLKHGKTVMDMMVEQYEEYYIQGSNPCMDFQVEIDNREIAKETIFNMVMNKEGYFTFIDAEEIIDKRPLPSCYLN